LFEFLTEAEKAENPALLTLRSVGRGSLIYGEVQRRYSQVSSLRSAN
jgi:hypothetical protein